MTPEAIVTREILLGTRHLVDWGRNNVGFCDQNPVCPHCGQRRDPQRGPRPVRYGCPGVGGTDWLGIRRSDGRAVLMEVKSTTGRVSKEQQQIIARAKRSGAIAFVARCLSDALEALR